MSTWTSERASTAAFTRAGNHAAADAARQRLKAIKAIKAEEYIKKLVDTAPPLAPEIRDRLAVLLRGAGPLGLTATPVSGRTTQAATPRCTTTAVTPEAGAGAQ